MRALHWFEAKQLDRVTNYLTETECIKNILSSGYKIYYYCTFAKKKEYFGLNGHIRYLGHFKNKYLKFVEFQLLVILKSLQVIIFSDRNVLMVNQNLVKNMLLAVFVNKLFRKHNKFILDVRTLPTSPETFEKDMQIYNKQIIIAVKYFNGLSFITPFLEKISLAAFDEKPLKTVNWSSGVNLTVFNTDNCDYSRDTKVFRIFYHGGISLSRGNLDLVKACEKVIEHGYLLELVQIGKIVDKEIVDYIDKSGINSWCIIEDAKPLEEMPALVAKCDLPILPFPNFMAWRVSSPIKLMEYLAMGKPVLVPDIECFKDILPADSCMVYYFNSHADNVIDEMANAIIERIIEHHISPMFIRNQQCIDYVTKNFTWETQSNNLLQFCIELCKETR